MEMLNTLLCFLELLPSVYDKRAVQYMIQEVNSLKPACPRLSITEESTMMVAAGLGISHAGQMTSQMTSQKTLFGELFGVTDYSLW